MAKKLIPNINHLRNDWRTTGGKPLPFGNKYNKLHDVFINAALSAYGPSIQRGGTNITKYYPLQKDRAKLAEEIADYLANKFNEIYPNKCTSFNKFTDWAKEVATHIRNFYHVKGVKGYTYGNAQKLINIAIKYILSSSMIDENDPLFKNCHFPVDSIIQKKMHKGFNIPYLSNKNHSWSRNDNWDDFVKYQKEARKIIQSSGYYSPLICEISMWQ